MLSDRFLSAFAALFVFTIGALSITSIAAPVEFVVTADDLEPPKVYSPYAGRNYPDEVLFGDTHFHTNLSVDAGLVGTRLGVDAGFRFARGEMVISNSGQPVQLIRPLDFLVITDHAELIGLAPMIQQSDPVLKADPWGKKIIELFNSGPEGRMEAFGSILQAGNTGVNPMASNDAVRSIWIDFVDKTDTYNEPGRFTAMAGFEWSSFPGGNNLHRVVIFRDGAAKTSRTLPFGTFDSDDPEDLWQYMAGYEDKIGGQVLAIPHNGNLSNGLMFSDKTLSGKRLNRDYAETRMRWEPLIEVAQECHL